MKKKKVSKVIVASIATVAGVFGGLKLYANRKRKLAEIQKIEEDHLETEA